MSFDHKRIDRILGEVAIKHGTTIAHLRSDSRLRKYSWPRQECYVRLRDETPMSYPQIARVMRRKDHTTVMYGERVCRERLRNAPEEP